MSSLKAPLSPPPVTAPPPAPRLRQVQRGTPIAARGEPFVWLTGAGLAFAALMIVGLLALVLYNGTATFWPRPLLEVTLHDGERVLGEVTRAEPYRPTPEEVGGLPPEARAAIADRQGLSRRRLFRVGNFDLTGDDFRWVSDHLVVGERRPAEAWMIERLEWGPAIAMPEALQVDGQAVATGEGLRPAMERAASEARARRREIRRLERDEIGSVNLELDRLRLEVRRAALESGEDSPQHREAAAKAAEAETSLHAAHRAIEERIAVIRAEDARTRLALRDVQGRLIPERPATQETPLLLSQVVRAYPANQLTLAGRLGVYLGRWKEFLTEEPREANTEGGVFPAIFGTFLMTVIMSLVVAPFGVIAALYLREYARQGPLVSAVRIAVNNLAGVPSIVFGVFGLGFFCYVVGGQVDQLFFAERLPSPTFGTGGILWASLTLALLTVPVVIVATEEAIAAVPRSMREGSFACGASKWQTIRNVVLPSATPGILTGLILAMARGAGEVAPLMITGVVKLAPELPFDGHFPYFHFERSFMHLGFHIYDVGFQSRNSEAAKPMVFTTTLLLIALIAALNLSAVQLRARLKRRYRTSAF